MVFEEASQMGKRGRNSQLDSRGKLGLYLTFMGSRMKDAQLSMIFGVVPSTINQIVNDILLLVVKKLKTHPASKIKFPKAAEMAIFARMVSNREPTVDNIIGFVDGLSIPVQ